MENKVVLLTDTPDVIRNKIRSAVTDTGADAVYNEANKPGIPNLMVILSLCSDTPLEDINGKYTGYGQFKNNFNDALVTKLEPIQKRYTKLSESGVVYEYLVHVATQAEIVANQKISEVKKKLGLVQR